MRTLFCILFFLFPLIPKCGNAGKTESERIQVLTVRTHAPENRNLKFYFRLPEQYDSNSRIMVLFGGRNWTGEETFSRYRFGKFADRHHLILLSPSFRNDEYWEPERWSGPALFSAIEQLEKKYQLKRRKMLYYGFSAGGQCANLFYAYRPDRVLAWAIHACGVYYNAEKIKNPVSALLSCGREDPERFEISKRFLYAYRESGGNLIWKQYETGHVFEREQQEIAECFFESILNSELIQFIGDDDSRQYYPVKHKNWIDVEFRNPLPSGKLLELWEKKP